MSQAESRPAKDVAGSIYITIMRTATSRTGPLSYSKVCDTFRPRIGVCATIRADLGAKSFVHFLETDALRNRFVPEHISECGPSCVKHRLGHAGFCQGGGVNVTDCDVIELPYKTSCQLVEKIMPRVSDTGMQACHLTALVCTPSARQLLSKLIPMPRVRDRFSCRERHQILQTEVDTDAGGRPTNFSLVNFDHDIKEPVAAPIAREVGPILDLSLWEGAGVKDTECVPGKAEGVTFTLEVAPFDRDPAERPFATVAQERAFLLRPTFGVLLAHRIDRTRMQSEVFATACGQSIQIESGEPASPPLERVLLPVITIIPDKVRRPALLVKQTAERLDTVTVDKNHEVARCKQVMLRPLHITQSSTKDSTCKRSEKGARFVCRAIPTRPEGRGFSRKF